MVSLELHHAKSTLYSSSRNHHKEHVLVLTQYLVFFYSHNSHRDNNIFHLFLLHSVKQILNNLPHLSHTHHWFDLYLSNFDPWLCLVKYFYIQYSMNKLNTNFRRSNIPRLSTQMCFLYIKLYTKSISIHTSIPNLQALQTTIPIIQECLNKIQIVGDRTSPDSVPICVTYIANTHKNHSNSDNHSNNTTFQRWWK